MKYGKTADRSFKPSPKSRYTPHRKSIMPQHHKFIFLSIFLFTILSCSSEIPSDISFQGQEYLKISKNTSSGNKFDIVKYSSGANDLYLIVPFMETDLDGFSVLYTKTFKAQGFSISSKGNRHIGTGASHIVYLTVSPKLKALSIFMTPRIENARPLIENSYNLFQNLNELAK
jgi:hypothetical protein